MYLNKVLEEIKNIGNYLNAIDTLINKNIFNDKILFICYDEKNEEEIYYYDNNHILYSLNKNELIPITNHNLLKELLLKYVTIFYKEAGNYSIQKFDYGIFNLIEAGLTLKDLDKKEKIINKYLELKKQKLVWNEKDILNFFNDKRKIITGDKENIKNIILQRVNLLKKENFQLFCNIFDKYFKSKKISQILFLIEKIYENKEKKKKTKNKALDGLRAIILNKNIKYLENIEKFNLFYYLVAKEIYLKNNRFYYSFFGEKFITKPLISKYNTFLVPENSVFDIYFFTTYLSKIKKENKLDEEDVIDKPIYYLKNQGTKIFSFDVLPSGEYFKIKPSIFLYLFDEELEINNLKNLLNVIEKIIISNTNSDNFIKKVFFKFAEKKDNEYILKLKLISKQELEFVLRELLHILITHKDYIISSVLKKYSGKYGNKTSIKIINVVLFLNSITNYLNKGEMMMKRIENYKMIIREFLNNNKEIESIDSDFLSFLTGLLIRYFVNKRKGDVTIGLITPIYENAKNFKQVKEELKKAMFSYGYEDKLSYKTNELVGLILAIEDESIIDKDLLLIGLLSNTFEILKIENLNKGE